MKLIIKLKNYMILFAMLITFVTSFQNVITTYAAENYTIDYFVKMPKTITLDGEKKGNYSITVSGSIPEYKRVYVSPIDGINDTENLDFYMINQVSENQKDNVPAMITQNKFYWNYEEVSNAYEESNNSITANGLSAGTWKGIFYIEISLMNDPNHEHSYTSEITKEPTCTEEGERTYTCKCGDTYIEKIPATGHNYGDDDVCIKCGELDPNHKHNYTSTVTKEPTCTEEGERTYTCKCGDTYTEKIPATGHNYGDDDICINCGELNPNHEHSYTSVITKEPTCIEEGEKTYTCKCGDTYTEKIPATGKHDYTETITKEPTCIDDGEKTYTCKYCGDTYTETIPSTGEHSFVDGECEHCGEKDPNYHNWVPLWFEHNTPSTLKVQSYVSSKNKSDSDSSSFRINIPSWYPFEISYSFSGYFSLGYSNTKGYAQASYFSGVSTSNFTSSAPSARQSATATIKPGSYLYVSASTSIQTDSNKNYGSANVEVTFPNLDTYLDKNNHYCTDCKITEPHYSNCTDDTKKEYYFCSGCGLQFRHKCVFSENGVLTGECGGSYYAHPCIKDEYDTTGKLFGKCSNTYNVDANMSHNYIAIQRRIKPVNPSGNVSNYGSVSTSKASTSLSSYLTIEVPSWYDGILEHTIKHSVRIPSSDHYQNAYLTLGPTRNSASYGAWNNRTFVSVDGTYDRVLQLHTGINYLTYGINSSDINSSYMSVSVNVPDVLLDRDLCTYHICDICKHKEKHYTSCTDETKDEYYFCEVCGQQFRHRCKFDDSDINFANCEGGDIDLICIDDYYDTTHDLFNTCGETSTIHFEGLGHDWQPWIVQVNPNITINANSSESKYTFTKSTSTKYDTYRGSIAIANGSLGSSGCSMELEITLPDNFNGTYVMPVNYNISSNSFTKNGYRMTVYCYNNYTIDGTSQNVSYLSYDLGYYTTSTGTTNGTMNIELHPGKNVISFSTGASTNLSSWQTGSNGGPSGSVSFSVTHTPFYVFEGNEVHKCSRCNLEESHTDKLHITDRIEATCINDGYIRYTCDDCHITYDEILPKHPDEHKDDDHDYFCDDCGKDLKTCEEFGHIMEHIKKTFEIPVTYSVSSSSKWYVDDGFYRLKLEAGKAYSSQGLTITYNVPSDFPGTYYSDRWRYVIVYNGENGGKWSYESTASTGKHTGGPYMSSGYAPLTLKAGTCSIYINCFSLGALVDVGTQFVVGIADSISLDVDVYHCTRCGRTENYDFSSEVAVKSLNQDDYSNGDTIYVGNSSLSFDDIDTIQEDITLSEKIGTNETISDETKKDNDISREFEFVTETENSVFEEESSQEEEFLTETNDSEISSN